MMKFLFIFFFLAFYSSCVSTKPAYDTVQNPSKLKPSERDIAYLKNISKIEDNNYDFISTQMQALIRNYKRMKEHLSDIEDKLDITLKKLESYKYKSLLGSKNAVTSPPVEDEIRIINKDNEEVILTINKLDDYKYIMGELVAGDYNISGEETERALNLLKKKLSVARDRLAQEDSEGRVSSPEKIQRPSQSATATEGQLNEWPNEQAVEEESEEAFDEDSLLEEKVTDELDLFSVRDSRGRQTGSDLL